MKTLFFVLLLVIANAPNVTAELPDWSTLVERARWAANAHNVQSWKLLPVPGRPDQKRLVLDAARLLPETDPPKRQLTISLGAFLAVLELEVGRRGAHVTWEPLTDAPGALVTLVPGSVADADAGAGWVDALTAPTVKYRSQAFELSPDVLARHAEYSTPTVTVRWETRTDGVTAIKAWAAAAYAVEMDLPRTRDESIGYTRYGADARRASPWGITLAPNFPRDQLFWVETFASWFPQSGEEYARSAKGLLADALKPVSQVLVLTSRGDGNAERLLTGVILQRLWLDVRSHGGELLPLSQGLQEFPEVASYRSQAEARWAEPGETVQMVLALFRPAPGVFLPSPRIEAAKLLSDD